MLKQFRSMKSQVIDMLSRVFEITFLRLPLCRKLKRFTIYFIPRTVISSANTRHYSEYIYI